jgi:hypothetical protein
LASVVPDDEEGFSWKDFLDHQLDEFPISARAVGYVPLHHSTPVKACLDQFHVHDCHYIKIIPADFGPDGQKSGASWYKGLPPDLRKQQLSYHLLYCLDPAWQISLSSHRATSKHMKMKPSHVFSRYAYAGTGGALSSIYFSKYKAKRPYRYDERCTTIIIPLAVAKQHRFTAVGDKLNGCDFLAKTELSIPITEM